MWNFLAGPIIDGISEHFKGKQKIKKAELDAKLITIKADADTKKAIALNKTKMAEEGQLNDMELDRIAMENMEKSWKDELILVIFLAPVVLSFIPSLQPYVTLGFTALEGVPEWYKYTLIGMIVVIYGMRGMLTKLMSRKPNINI